jgi:hypothetical protein
MSHFQVHTTLLAIESIGTKERYVTVPVGTLGDIVDGSDTLDQPGFVEIRIQGKTFYTFARDLHQNAYIELPVHAEAP